MRGNKSLVALVTSGVLTLGCGAITSLNTNLTPYQTMNSIEPRISYLENLAMVFNVYENVTPLEGELPVGFDLLVPNLGDLEGYVLHIEGRDSVEYVSPSSDLNDDGVYSRFHILGDGQFENGEKLKIGISTIDNLEWTLYDGEVIFGETGLIHMIPRE
ncbi:MAG: hypothetical protein KAQ83_03050 [Nanoarchaeota archaeon]|nr:hypothetical protein [Nanoarchaeota archaeon]